LSPARVYALLASILLVVGISGLTFVVLKPFLAAIAWAIVLAVGFAAPWRYVLKVFRGRRTAAAVTASLLVALVVILPAGLLATAIFGQAMSATASLKEKLKEQKISSFGDLVSLPPVQTGLKWVEARTGLTPEVVKDRVGEAAGALSSGLAALSGGLVVGFVDTVMSFLTTIFLLFFLFRDGDELVAAMADLLPMEPDERNELLASLGRMLQSIFRGSLLCAAIQGATGGLGWWLAGLPSPVLASVAMAILSLLPIGGTAIVWLPGAVALWIGGHTGAAIFLAAWGLVVASFLADNVLKPFLIGGADELNTVVVFLGVFGGIAAFGLLGVFIGPITLAMFATLVEARRRQVAARATPAPESV